MKRSFLKMGFGVGVAALSTFSCEAKQPNFLFIIADDCTFRDIGCYGGQAHTPNIDALAKQGMKFTRAFQTAPMCSPTRHNIYTGQDPVKSGAYPNHTRVDEGTKSVVQYLGDLGYRVGHAGKSHVVPSSVFAWEQLGSTKKLELDKVDEFMASCKSDTDPFCLLVCSKDPHTPWSKGDPSAYPTDKVKLPSYFVDTPETRDGMSRYLAEITYFDNEVGKTLASLEKHGFADDTLVILVSEQGNAFPFAKWTCYDNGLQSAFIARWPGKIEPNTVNPAMIGYVDILPTFIDAAGGTPDPILDGKSLLPVFAGKQDHKKYVHGVMTTRGIGFGSDYFGIRSVRSDKFKYIWNFTPEMKFSNACTESPEFKSWEALAEQGDAKAIELVNKYRFRPEIELYDISVDPFEMNNLADNPEYESVKKELRAELDRWMKHNGDEGQATELKAFERMGAGRQKKMDDLLKGKKKGKK